MFRERLSSWTKRRGYASQAEAAAALGISRPMLNRMLSGSLPTVSRRNAEKIHMVTGIPLRVMGYAPLALPETSKKGNRTGDDT